MHYAYPTDIVLQLLTTTLTRHPHPTQAYSQGAPLTHDCYTLHNSITSIAYCDRGLLIRYTKYTLYTRFL